MKVLMINGSPHEAGCTFTALSEVAGQLEAAGIETKILHVASKPVRGCVACGGCKKIGRCVYDDIVNTAIEEMAECDGLVVGSPVYYASANGSLISFLDRFFYAGRGRFAYKPAAAVVSARRAGTTATFEVLNKYFTMLNMPVVSSKYWNMVHGSTPEDVRQDLEGLQVMRTLGRNMAWMLRCFEAGRQAGILPPEAEPAVSTNFIR